MRPLTKLYKDLLRQYGHQNWWPVAHSFKPPQLEVCVGAILTQNTNWKNVEKALENLAKSKKLTAESIASCSIDELEKLIRPSGFYKQKAKRLGEFCSFVAEFDGDFYKDITREQLLTISGIGHETADSMLLYACGKTHFVIDAYTRRILKRMGMINGDEKYDELKTLFENNLPKDAALYKEFHALIVENEKSRRIINKKAAK